MNKLSVRVLVLALASLMIFAACGDDEADPLNDAGRNENNERNDDDGKAQGDLTAFCDAVIAAENAVIQAAAGGPTEELPALLDATETAAPEELLEQVRTVITTVKEASESQDDSAFEDEGFQSADEEVDVFVAQNCELETVQVDAVDYAFEGLPQTLAAGDVSVKWTNKGEEVHEMVALKILDDKMSAAQLLKMPQKKAQKKVQFVRGFFGPPGTEDTETLTLEPGRYMGVCFIPVGTTSLDEADGGKGKPHFLKGMVTEFTVE